MSTTQPGASPVARTSTQRTERTAVIVFVALAYGLSWAVRESTLAQQNGSIKAARTAAAPAGDD